MAGMGVDKDTAALVKEARKAGWEVLIGDHVKFIPPVHTGGRMIVGAKSGCGPGQRKLISQVRKAIRQY